MSDTHKKKSIAVVGGGITGITAAIELAKIGRFNVTLFEKENQLGGLSSSYRWKDIICDRFYHVILPDDSYLFDLIKELNLESSLFWKPSKSGFYGEKKLVSFASIWDFIRFPFLSYLQKLRLAFGIAYSITVKDVAKLDNILANKWLNKVFGKRVYSNFWKPLLKSKLGDAKETISAAFIWSTIIRLYGARSSAGKQEEMGHVVGGYNAILNAMRERLSGLNVSVLTNSEVTNVKNINDKDNRVTLTTNSQAFEFDEALLTVSCPTVLRILRNSSENPYWNLLESVEYLGVVCVLVVLKKRLSSYYVINLLDNDLPFTGIIESTNIFSPKDFNDKHLVYLPRYVTQGDPINELSDGQIIDLFMKELHRVFSELKKEDILHIQIFREKYVQPVHGLKYLEQKIDFQTPLPNVYLSNTAMIFGSTLNNNAAIKLAQEAAQTIISDKNSPEEKVRKIPK